MRSRNQGGESSTIGHNVNCNNGNALEEENLGGDAKNRNKVYRNKEGDMQVSGTVKRHGKSTDTGDRKNRKLNDPTKDDLVKLLSVMEGELQVWSYY